MIKGKKMRSVLKFMLYCEGDPRSLGIEDDNGKWDLTALKRHIEECERCKRFWTVLTKEMLDRLEKEFGRAKRGAEGGQINDRPQSLHPLAKEERKK
ncbi:unnamed protein product [marine sediment metagenome]|uniref:Uncharacterized protein n=1 Tax=marine sediment metagenome TaxID=412755 RepID=X1Q0A3_9ZZZZ